MGQQLFLTRRRRLERDSRTPYQQPFILYRHNYILPVGRCYPDLACRCSLYPETGCTKLAIPKGQKQKWITGAGTNS